MLWLSYEQGTYDGNQLYIGNASMVKLIQARLRILMSAWKMKKNGTKEIKEDGDSVPVPCHSLVTIYYRNVMSNIDGKTFHLAAGCKILTDTANVAWRYKKVSWSS